MTLITAEIISIGDELLNGQTINTNASWIAKSLDSTGIKTTYITTIADSKNAITSSLKLAQSRVSLILITGGLGPTKDDITKKTIAEYFDSPLVRNIDHYNLLDNYFTTRGRVMNELNKTQADIPECSTYIQNDNGTAPGMWFEDHNTIIMSMPGVPREMKTMMTHHVLPKVKNHFKTEIIEHRFIYTVGIGESDLAILIEDWENRLPENIKLAYLPSLGTVKLRLTATGKSQLELKNLLDETIAELKPLISDNIYSETKPNLEEVVSDILVDNQLTIATAESCTGGYIAHKLTSIPGSSRYFEGSIISYSNRIKEEQLGVSAKTLKKHGAVSEQTVKEMAENIRLKYNTDIGIACSGIAGPEGGTDEKPVGTVWISYSDKYQTITKLLQLRTERATNIELTSLALLNLIRKTLILKREI